MYTGSGRTGSYAVQRRIYALVEGHQNGPWPAGGMSLWGYMSHIAPREQRMTRRDNDMQIMNSQSVCRTFASRWTARPVVFAVIPDTVSTACAGDCANRHQVTHTMAMDTVLPHPESHSLRKSSTNHMSNTYPPALHDSIHSP